jgi:MFS family permease
MMFKFKINFGVDKPTLNKALKILLLISGTFMFADALFMPIYALFVEEIGGDITTASTAWSLFWLITGILTIFISRLENELKETELAIAWSQYVMSLGYLMYFFTTNIAMLYVVMIILGIGNALFWPAFHAVYSEHTNKKNSEKQWGVYDGVGFIVPAIGAGIGGWIVKLYGFDVLFLTMSILAFIVGTFIVFLPRKIL